MTTPIKFLYLLLIIKNSQIIVDANLLKRSPGRIEVTPPPTQRVTTPPTQNRSPVVVVTPPPAQYNQNVEEEEEDVADEGEDQDGHGVGDELAPTRKGKGKFFLFLRKHDRFLRYLFVCRDGRDK